MTKLKENNPQGTANITDDRALATVFTESVKARMASEWSKSRSIGNRDQDRDCYYDYLMGIEAAVRLMSNGK